MRTACESFGSHLVNRSAAASSRGLRFGDISRASLSSHSRSSAHNCKSHASPYGRSKLARPSPRRYAASCCKFSAVRLFLNASRAAWANGASGNVRSSRTSSQWPCTEECQSYQPQNAGVSFRGGATSASLLSTWLILFGYSLCTHASASLAKRSAACASNDGELAGSVARAIDESNSTKPGTFFMVSERPTHDLIYRLPPCQSPPKPERRRSRAFAGSPLPADPVGGTQLPAMHLGDRRTSRFPPRDTRDGPAVWFHKEDRLHLI